MRGACGPRAVDPVDLEQMSIRILRSRACVDQTSRRTFIKTLGATAAGLVLAPAVFTQRRRKKCIVIGAGFAGLAAAYKLKNAGWDVTVLEARDRIGGRVFSHKFANTELICELGAEWVGESHERIKALCHDFKIPLQKHQFEEYLLRDGRVSRPGEWGFSAQAKTAFEKLIAGYEKLTPLAKTSIIGAATYCRIVVVCPCCSLLERRGVVIIFVVVFSVPTLSGERPDRTRSRSSTNSAALA